MMTMIMIVNAPDYLANSYEYRDTILDIVRVTQWQSVGKIDPDPSSGMDTYKHRWFSRLINRDFKVINIKAIQK